MDSQNFFGTEGFMPHGMCYLWQPGILALHVVSDALIAAAYFSIPFTLAHLVRKRRDIDFNWMIVCFAVFIVACGTTHLMEIVTIWHPVYWLAGSIKAITAAASVPTAILLVRLMPQALRWPSPVTLKRANEELRLANARLVAEGAERRAAQDAADRANQAKGRFLATASHDLRQPLQTLSFLNGALRRLATNPDAVSDLVEQEHAIVAMSGLLNALLDISKLESGAVKPQIRDFNLASLFEELRVEFSALAIKKGLRLEIAEVAAVASSDPTLLGEILRNLVSNAIRYTVRGVVQVHCFREEADLRIDVEDSGVGIAENQLPLIFDEFYQIRVSPDSPREGHGLGLSIVQRAATLLNREVRVRSEVGRGSTFSISIPAAPMSGVERTSTHTPAVAAPARHLHVLIVDDEPAVLNAICRLLNVAGFRVSTARSLSEAVRLAREHDDIELLITDYHLANGELGTDVIEVVRGSVGPRLRAVLLSGDTSSALREIMRDDAIRLASKPVRAEELLGLLGSLSQD